MRVGEVWSSNEGRGGAAAAAAAVLALQPCCTFPRSCWALAIVGLWQEGVRRRKKGRGSIPPRGRAASASATRRRMHQIAGALLTLLVPPTTPSRDPNLPGRRGEAWEQQGGLGPVAGAGLGSCPWAAIQGPAPAARYMGRLPRRPGCVPGTLVAGHRPRRRRRPLLPSPADAARRRGAAPASARPSAQPPWLPLVHLPPGALVALAPVRHHAAQEAHHVSCPGPQRRLHSGGVGGDRNAAGSHVCPPALPLPIPAPALPLPIRVLVRASGRLLLSQTLQDGAG